ncbi:MAG TPA: riboflavin synthase, partial [Bacteroidales bacterium]|nr:riboflavin synthase [Bacteroidales bacterium]
MFTGIIEKMAKVVAIEQENTNYHFTLEVDFAKELKIDQSMAHDGCCLTVVKLDYDKNQYVVTAMKETMDKTNLSTWQVGTEVNVERSMKMDGRFDGHIVQGHVDQIA